MGREDGAVPQLRPIEEQPDLDNHVAQVHRVTNEAIGALRLHATVGGDDAEAAPQRQLGAKMDKQSEDHQPRAERCRNRAVATRRHCHHGQDCSGDCQQEVERPLRHQVRRPAEQQEAQDERLVEKIDGVGRTRLADEGVRELDEDQRIEQHEDQRLQLAQNPARAFVLNH